MLVSDRRGLIQLPWYAYVIIAVIVGLGIVYSSDTIQQFQFLQTPEQKRVVDLGIALGSDYNGELAPHGSEEILFVLRNTGNETATDVTLTTDSSAVIVASEPVDVKGESVMTLEGIITAKDAKDGYYDVNVIATFTSSQGVGYTYLPLTFYIRPLVEVTDIRWAPTVSQLGGKNRLDQNDETTLIFSLRNKSELEIYDGLYAKANFVSELRDILVEPPSVRIDSIGPRSVASEHSFQIKTGDDIPYGNYKLQIEIYSKDDKLASVSESVLLIVEDRIIDF